MNKYKLSIYVNKPMNRTNGIHQDIHQDGEIISIIGGAVPYSMMESDIVFTVSRGDNYINTKINIVKNRFGKENKSVEVLL